MTSTDLFNIIFHTGKFDKEWLHGFLSAEATQDALKKVLPAEYVPASRFDGFLSDRFNNITGKSKNYVLGIPDKNLWVFKSCDISDPATKMYWERAFENLPDPKLPTKKEKKLEMSIFFAAVIASQMKANGMNDLIKFYLFAFEMLNIHFEDENDILKKLCPYDVEKEIEIWKKNAHESKITAPESVFDILTVTIYLTLCKMNKKDALDQKISDSWRSWLYINLPKPKKERPDIDIAIRACRNTTNEPFGLVKQYEEDPRAIETEKNLQRYDSITADDISSQILHENEIDQSLRCKKAFVSNSITPRLENLMQYKRIIIEGKGGMGKTTFLQHVYLSAKEASLFSFVCMLSLPTLISADKTKSKASQIPNRLMYFKNGITKIANLPYDALFRAATEEGQKPVLLLLDGFNELLACMDALAVQRIRNELGIINKTWQNAIILIASQPISSPIEVAQAYEDELDGFFTCYLSGVPAKQCDELLRAHPDMSEELKSIVCIPLYYSLLRSLDSKSTFPTNRYSLFLRIHNSRFEQIIDRTKDINDLSLYYFAFFVAVPHIARVMCHNNTAYRLDKTTILEIINDLLVNKQAYVQALLFDIAYVDFSYNKEYNAAHILKLLHGNDVLKKTDNYGYTFSHDDWAEFYAAYSYVTDANLIRHCYTNEGFSRHIHIDLNLSTSAVRLVREGLLIESADSDLLEAFSDFFREFKYNRRIDCLCGEIKYMNLLFQFVDYLQIERIVESSVLPNLRKRMMDILKRALPEYKQEFHSASDFPEAVALNELFVVICKMCELCRRNHDFAAEYQYLEWADELLAVNDGRNEYALSQRLVKHQKAKAFLQNFQSRVLNEQIVSDIPGIPDVAAYWAKGYAFLSDNAKTGHNLSSNLLGFIQSNPAPFLIEKGLMPMPDPVAGFGTYYASIKASQMAFSHWERGDLVYTIRNAVALLLKGYVEIADDGSFVAGNAQPDKISKNTLDMAHALLDYAAGQQYTFLEFLRGYLLLLQGNLDQAESHFLREDGLMSRIILKYVYRRYYDLEPCYNKMKNRLALNHIDETAEIYFYIDAKKLELAYVPKTIYNKRMAFFRNFEREMTETCKNLLKQYKA